MTVDNMISLLHGKSLTSVERTTCFYNSLEYVRHNNIQGDYVECGVWRGGKILGILKYLEFHQNTTPNVWLYDTFSGMTPPEDIDVDFRNKKAADIFHEVSCMNSLDGVKQMLSDCTYPADKIKYVVGDVCETLLNPANVPDKIALLLLDTDWYKSTKVELDVLWEKLEVGAPCIIDDFGHWAGCKKAVIEFFKDRACPHGYEQIDYTGIRVFKKC